MTKWEQKRRTSARADAAKVELESGVLVPRRVTLFVEGGQRNGLKDPDATFHFEFRGDVPVCTGVRVVADRATRGITNLDLRSLDLDALMREAFWNHRWEPVQHNVEGERAYTVGDSPAAGLSTMRVKEIMSQATSPHQSRESARVLEDVRLAKWADVELKVRARRQAPSVSLLRTAYVYMNDTTGRPREAVMEELGLTRTTAARRIDQARQAGLIPPVGAGAEEKERARRALEGTGERS